MPLSEQEQRLLEEMERSLYHNDADFVATVSPRGGKPNYRSIVVGILVAIAGIAAIVTGVVIHQPVVGIIGFVIMFAGVLLALSRPRHSATAPTHSSGPGPQKQKAGFMDRMNDRWDKRQEGHDR
jgi:hypothetical protein